MLRDTGRLPPLFLITIIRCAVRSIQAEHGGYPCNVSCRSPWAMRDPWFIFLPIPNWRHRRLLAILACFARVLPYCQTIKPRYVLTPSTLCLCAFVPLCLCAFVPLCLFLAFSASIAKDNFRTLNPECC